MHSLSKTTPIYAIRMISLLFSAPLSAQDKVRVGLSSVSATNGSIWVAEDKGLFRKHGIDVEVIDRFACSCACQIRSPPLAYIAFRSRSASQPRAIR